MMHYAKLVRMIVTTDIYILNVCVLHFVQYNRACITRKGTKEIKSLLLLNKKHDSAYTHRIQKGLSYRFANNDN